MNTFTKTLLATSISLCLSHIAFANTPEINPTSLPKVSEAKSLSSVAVNNPSSKSSDPSKTPAEKSASQTNTEIKIVPAVRSVGSARASGDVVYVHVNDGAATGGNADTNSGSPTSKAGAQGLGSIAIGMSAKTKDIHSIAMGTNANTAGFYGIALGMNASSTGVYDSIALGRDSESTEEGAISVGYFSKAKGKYALAIGKQATVTGNGAVAYGYKAQALKDNAIAIGQGSVANAENTVSFGNDTLQRKIINVASGQVTASSHEVITGTELYTSLTSIQEILGLADEAVEINSNGNGSLSLKDNSKIGNSTSTTIVGAINENIASIKTNAISIQTNAASIKTNATTIKELKTDLGNVTTATSNLKGYFHVNKGEHSGMQGVGDASTNEGGMNDKAGALGYYSITAGINAKATGGDAIAQGRGATANGGESIALGHKATVNKGAGSSIAIGKSATAEKGSAIALGVNTKAEGAFSMAMGENATAKEEYGIAFGLNSKADSVNNVAFGFNSHTTKNGAIAFGGTAISNGEFAIAFGNSVNAIGNRAIAFGVFATADGENAVAFGNGSKALDTQASAFGVNAEAKEENSLAIGSSAYAGKERAVAIGTLSKVGEVESITLGSYNNVTGQKSGTIGVGNVTAITDSNGAVTGYSYDYKNEGNNSYAIGNLNSIAQGSDNNFILGNEVNLGDKNPVQNAVVLGNKGDVTVDAGVALGSFSVADRKALGLDDKGNFTGPIQTSDGIKGDKIEEINYLDNNVFAFVNSKDSDGNNVNNPYSQAVIATVKGNLGAVSVGYNGGTRQITNVAAGSADTDAVNVAQLKSVLALIEDLDLEYVANGGGTPVPPKGDGAVAPDAGAGNTPSDTDTGSTTPDANQPNPGDKSDLESNGEGNIDLNKGHLNFVDGENTLATVGPDGKVNFDLKDEITLGKGDKAVTINGNTGTITTGKTTVNGKGVSIEGGPSMTTEGINAGGKVISHVAKGVADTDAVNVSQLKEATGDIINNIQNINNKFDHKLDVLRKDLNASAAGSNAAVGLPQVTKAGRSMIAASAGAYRDQSAVAVGFSRMSDNGKFIFKAQGNANTQGHFGGSVGVGYQW